MNVGTETNWKGFLDEGLAYSKTVEGGVGKPGVFTPEILYNVGCMAIEKFFMAFLVKHGKMPDNHTLRELCEAAETVTPLPPGLRGRLLEMDMWQFICSIDLHKRKKLTREDVPEILAAVRGVKEWTGLARKIRA
jgi:hypothetical protein